MSSHRTICLEGTFHPNFMNHEPLYSDFRLKFVSSTINHQPLRKSSTLVSIRVINDQIIDDGGSYFLIGPSSTTVMALTLDPFFSGATRYFQLGLDKVASVKSTDVGDKDRMWRVLLCDQ